jgi:phage terminase large subunit-like protein
VESFFVNKLMSRVNAETNIYLMYHAWAVGDIGDYAVEKYGFRPVRFPEIADANEDGDDPTGRKPGELLSPRMSEELSLSHQLNDPKMFASMYQGKPTSDSEGLFQASMFEFVEHWEVPPLQTLYRGWDTAAKAKQSNDPTACLKFGVDSQGTIWIIDAFWEWLNWGNLCATFCSTVQGDGYTTIQAVEDASSGVQLFEEMINPATRPEMASYNIHSVSHGNKDKRFRATPIATRASVRPIMVVKFGKHKELVKHFTDFDGRGLSFDHTIDAFSTAWTVAFKEEGERQETHASRSFKARAGISN